MHFGLQARVAIQIVLFGDALAVLENLRALGVLLGRDVAGLFEQRHIHVGLDVTREAGVAVEVPGATHVGCFVDQPQALDTELTQPGSREQTTEPGADDRDVDVVGDGLTREVRIGPRIISERREVTRDLDVLVDPIRTQPPVPLKGILSAQRIRVEGHRTTIFVT